MNKEKLFLIIVIIVGLGIIGFLVFKPTENHVNNPNVEISGDSGDLEPLQEENPLGIFELPEPKKIEGEKKYKGLTVSNIEVQLISARQCEVRANVRNETGKIIEMQNIKLELYDANGNLLETIGAQIDSVEAGGHTEVFAMLRRDDVSDIAKIEIKEN